MSRRFGAVTRVETTRGTRARAARVRVETMRGSFGAAETSRATSGGRARGVTEGGETRRRARREGRTRAVRGGDDVQGVVEGARSSARGGLLYVRNFFEPETYERVAKECSKLGESVTAENRACARHRLGVMVPMDNFVHEACVASSVAERLGTLLLGEENDGDLVAGDVPVEFRIYPVGGSMDWHKDVALYRRNHSLRSFSR